MRYLACQSATAETVLGRTARDRDGRYRILKKFARELRSGWRASRRLQNRDGRDRQVAADCRAAAGRACMLTSADTQQIAGALATTAAVRAP
jgi:hypothetical protein